MPSNVTVYAYKNCDTCRKALRYLDARAIPYKVIGIRETPPSITQLRAALTANGGEIRKLFNTSGGDYKALHMKERLPEMDVEAALQLLHENGNLVKRPFLVGPGITLVGFREDQWDEAFRSR